MGRGALRRATVSPPQQPSVRLHALRAFAADVDQMKQAIIFVLGLGIIMGIAMIGTEYLLRKRATMQSQVDTMNCFIHHLARESC